MKTTSEFYLRKHENELALLKGELKMKHEISSLVKTKDIISNLLKLPFQNSNTEEVKTIDQTTSSESSDNLFQNGIQLFHSIKEIITLSKSVIQKIKS